MYVFQCFTPPKGLLSWECWTGSLSAFDMFGCPQCVWYKSFPDLFWFLVAFVTYIGVVTFFIKGIVAESVAIRGAARRVLGGVLYATTELYLRFDPGYSARLLNWLPLQGPIPVSDFNPASYVDAVSANLDRHYNSDNSSAISGSTPEIISSTDSSNLSAAPFTAAIAPVPTNTFVRSAGSRSRYDGICKYWLESSCKKTASDCKYAHYVDPTCDVGRPSSVRRPQLGTISEHVLFGDDVIVATSSNISHENPRSSLVTERSLRGRRETPRPPDFEMKYTSLSA